MADYGTENFICFMYYDDFAHEWHNTRKNYYGVSGYPDCRINGYIDEGGGSTSGTTYDRILPRIEAEMARPSLLNMSLTLDTTGGVTGTVNGHIEALQNCPPAKVHIVIYEEPGPRQPHVSRHFAVYNADLTVYEAGQTQDLNATFPIDASWVAGDLQAVMFVQNAGLGSGIVAGAGPGPNNTNEVYEYYSSDLFNGNFWAENWYEAYGPNKYGTNVAVGDIDGDRLDEILTGPGPGAVFGPHVRGFDWGGTPIDGLNFLAYGTAKFGVNVCAAQLDDDMYAEIVTGAGPGAVFGPHVRGWNFDGGGSVDPYPGISYFAYGTPKWGVNVSAGDLDGDGYDEIVTGAGPGAVYGPHVRGWNFDNSAIAAMPNVSFLAYGTAKFGVNVACGDIDGDGFDEILTGAGPGAVFGPHLRGWNVDGGAVTAIGNISTFVFDYDKWGVNVSAGDVDGDGIDEILVSTGPGEDYIPMVRVFDYDGGSMGTPVLEFQAFWRPERAVTHGCNVVAGNF